jgi:7-cyano-7-deazaguanine reductase
MQNTELASPLGKQSSYINTYDQKLLFPIPRERSRHLIGLNSPCPFSGVDIWTGFELSWLNSKGKPQVAAAEFWFSSESVNLIESKSFKLYLNSFNQTSYASFEEVQKILETDLSNAAQGQVDVTLMPLAQFEMQKITPLEGTCLDDLDIATTTYEVDPDFLKTDHAVVQETLYSHLLKSNCLVTGQPDWASLMIRYMGPQIDHEGLLKYIISFRNHQGFHEQCVEQIFCDILKHCQCTKLTVYARYTRRGGLDINPFRSNWESAPQSNHRLVRQ